MYLPKMFAMLKHSPGPMAECEENYAQLLYFLIKDVKVSLRRIDKFNLICLFPIKAVINTRGTGYLNVDVIIYKQPGRAKLYYSVFREQTIS